MNWKPTYAHEGEFYERAHARWINALKFTAVAILFVPWIIFKTLRGWK